MNIVIVSKDSFFISGVITLIRETWQPECGENPVFLVADANRELLTADIIITDGIKSAGRTVKRAFSRALRISDDLSKVRILSVWLAAPCHTNNRSCRQHKFQVDKSESKRCLTDLFSRKTALKCSPINVYAPYRCGTFPPIVLSKQQAMVVKYVRQGLSLTDISRLTSLSVKTISTHKRAVMRKLGMKNNRDFYRYALVGSNPP